MLQDPAPPLARSTVSKAIDKLMTYKLKLMRAKLEHYNDQPHVDEWQQWAQQVMATAGNMNSFVFIDEAGFNLHIHHKYGRAARGRHAIQRVPYNCGPNMSLLVAIDHTGILTYNFKHSAYNQESFTEFLQDKLFPILQEGPPCYLLMDNAKFHKTKRVRDAIADTGHIQKLLPPYSPHLNAAESIFSSVKVHVHKEVVKAETLSGHVSNALRQITATMATGWICEVGWNFELSILGCCLGDLYDTRQALPPRYGDPYIEYLDMVQNPDLENEAEEEEEEEEGEEEGEEEEEDKEEEEEPLVHSCRKYSPLSTHLGKVWSWQYDLHILEINECAKFQVTSAKLNP